MGLSSHLNKAGKLELPKMERRSEPDLLLHPNIPKPLHGVNPRTLLGRKWWDTERKEAQLATNFHCLACGVHKTVAKARQWLEGHEIYDINYSLGIAEYVRTVSLCHYCHNYIHDGRLQALLEKNQLSHQKYSSIIRHGDLVLSTQGLFRPSREERERDFIAGRAFGNAVEWEGWRMIVGKKMYKPLFKNLVEWTTYHSEKKE